MSDDIPEKTMLGGLVNKSILYTIDPFIPPISIKQPLRNVNFQRAIVHLIVFSVIIMTMTIVTWIRTNELIITQQIVSAKDSTDVDAIKNSYDNLEILTGDNSYKYDFMKKPYGWLGVSRTYGSNTMTYISSTFDKYFDGEFGLELTRGIQVQDQLCGVIWINITSLDIPKVCTDTKCMVAGLPYVCGGGTTNITIEPLSILKLSEGSVTEVFAFSPKFQLYGSKNIAILTDSNGNTWKVSRLSFSTLTDPVSFRYKFKEFNFVKTSINYRTWSDSFLLTLSLFSVLLIMMNFINKFLYTSIDYDERMYVLGK